MWTTPHLEPKAQSEREIILPEFNPYLSLTLEGTYTLEVENWSKKVEWGRVRTQRTQLLW